MTRDPIISLLKKHNPADQQEQQMLTDAIRFIEDNPDCFERCLLKGHVTGPFSICHNVLRPIPASCFHKIYCNEQNQMELFIKVNILGLDNAFQIRDATEKRCALVNDRETVFAWALLERDPVG